MAQPITAERIQELAAEGRAKSAGAPTSVVAGHSEWDSDPLIRTAADAAASEDLSPRRRIRPLVDVEPEDVEWLLYPYIPRRKLTLLEGDPGLGKSWVAFNLATVLSVGGEIAGVGHLSPGVSIIASAEDGAADTIRPRIEAMGADLTKVHVIEDPLALDEEGMCWLGGHIERLGASLVILDPLFSFMGGAVDIHRANETRAILGPLARLAESTGCAILGIRHLTKGGKERAIYRGLGSIDITAAARSVLLAGADPDDPADRAVVHIKSNLAPTGPSLGYSLSSGQFAWTGPSALTEESVLGAGNNEERGARQEAAEVLGQSLADGIARPSDEVMREVVRLTGFSEKTVRRAQKDLSVNAFREGEPGRRGGGRWMWQLGVRAGLGGQDARVGNLATLTAPEYESVGAGPRSGHLNSHDQAELMDFEL